MNELRELRESYEHFRLSEDEKKELEQLLRKNPRLELTRYDFDEFFRTGKRVGYEAKYFSRRERLNALFLLAHEDASYKEALNETIADVLNEITWGLPAHCDPSAGDEAMAQNIDLFSAETGQTLAELKYLMGEEMDADLGKRISEQLERRIIKPFLERKFGWESLDNNWSAVCGGCVGMVCAYEAPETAIALKERLVSIMDAYMQGFGEDGACTEGVYYWIYGFGYYTYFAQLYAELTGGETDLLASEKAHSVAKFQQNMYISRNGAVSFSDSTDTGHFQIGLTDYLCRRYKDVYSPQRKYAQKQPDCGRFAHFIRSYLWRSAEPKCSDSDMYAYYPNAQWYIHKTGKAGFAAKGGHNGESHNHNDIGTFIIAQDGKQIVADTGAGEYTAEYFRDATRYNNLSTSSLGHSVPIIDGKGQKASAEYGAKLISARENEFALDIAGAYGIAGLKSLTRKFSFEDNVAVMEDKIEQDGSVGSIVERFVLNSEPKYKDGKLYIDGICAESEQGAKITSETIKAHDGSDRRIWLADYEVSGNAFRIVFKLA